jgi:hypothetical protein
MIYDTSYLAHMQNPQVLWDNMLLSATLTVSAETASGLGVSCLTQSTNDGWSCPNVTGTLTGVWGAAVGVSMVGIAAHNLGGKTVAVDYWNGAAWVEAISRVVASGAAVMLSFERRVATQWRLRVSGGAFRIGVLYMGVPMIVPGVIQPPHTPLHTVETVRVLDGNISRNGQFLQSEIEEMNGIATLNFMVQRPEFALGVFDAFRLWFNRGNAFFIACYPSAWPKDMGYCWREGAEVTPPWRDAVFFDLSMQVGVYRG